MKNIKYILIILVLLIIIGIAAIIYLNSDKIDNKQVEKNISGQQTTSASQKINANEVTNSAMYFTVKSCVDTYMEYLSNRNKEAIYGVLDKSYIQENNIDSNNVLNNVKVLNGENIDFSIQEMRVQDEGEDIQTYYIKGTMRDNKNNKEEAEITVKIDINNKVFTIIPDVAKGVFDE